MVVDIIDIFFSQSMKKQLFDFIVDLHAPKEWLRQNFDKFKFNDSPDFNNIRLMDEFVGLFWVIL